MSRKQKGKGKPDAAKAAKKVISGKCYIDDCADGQLVLQTVLILTDDGWPVQASLCAKHHKAYWVVAESQTPREGMIRDAAAGATAMAPRSEDD